MNCVGPHENDKGPASYQKQVFNPSKTVFHKSCLEKSQKVSLAKIINKFGKNGKQYGSDLGNQIQIHIFGLIQAELR